jgi:hypothetical protein
MTSVQRKFAASLITLLITLSLSYTGQTTKLTPDDCNENSALATRILECLKLQGIKPAKLCTTERRIEVVLSGNKDEPVDCKIINAIRKCTLAAVDYEPGYELNISIAPSTAGDPPQSVYYGITDHDPDKMPKCIDVLALAGKGTLKISFRKVKHEVKGDAKRLGIKIDDLEVKPEKRECDKLRLRVLGEVLEAPVGGEQVKKIVADLVSKYTLVQTIDTNNLNTDKLKAPIAKR